MASFGGARLTPSTVGESRGCCDQEEGRLDGAHLHSGHALPCSLGPRSHPAVVRCAGACWLLSLSLAVRHPNPYPYVEHWGLSGDFDCNAEQQTIAEQRQTILTAQHVIDLWQHHNQQDYVPTFTPTQLEKQIINALDFAGSKKDRLKQKYGRTFLCVMYKEAQNGGSMPFVCPANGTGSAYIAVPAAVIGGWTTQIIDVPGAKLLYALPEDNQHLLFLEIGYMHDTHSDSDVGVYSSSHWFEGGIGGGGGGGGVKVADLPTSPLILGVPIYAAFTGAADTNTAQQDAAGKYAAYLKPSDDLALWLSGKGPRPPTVSEDPASLPSDTYGVSNVIGLEVG